MYGNVGVPIAAFPGYGVNAARMNGADIEPVPITPVRWQNWPAMQVQLHNGWMKITNKKVATDSYLRLLSHRQPGANYNNLPSGGPIVGPAPGNVQDHFNQTAGAQPSSPGGPGMLPPHLIGTFRGRF